MFHASVGNIRDGRDTRPYRGWPIGPIVAFSLAVAVSFALGAARVSADATLPNCETCHGNYHGDNWQGCSGCHESPPSTGSHLLHYGSAPVKMMRYGDTGISSTADAYKFGCGNCHPLDSTYHRDGTVEVELYNAQASPDSLKGKNPATAAYDKNAKTCTNVYCHSGLTITTGAVSTPLTSPPYSAPPGSSLNGTYIMDSTCSNLTYEAYTVTAGRSYATTPAWGTTGNFTACTECHQFPLTTYDPAVKAGAGDSHQWIDEFGYSNLHAWNMSYASYGAVACRTCHYDTVRQAGTTNFTWTAGKDLIVYGPVPIASRVPHVNGVPDVTIDPVDPVQYGSSNTYSLSGASYDPATKTCTNVACHSYPGKRYQTAPKWGSPYRWWNDAECDLCHRRDLAQTCQPVP